MLKTTVLIVEDEAPVAEDLRDRLERLGHTVAGVADTAAAAVAAARRQAPGLILMDIRLGGAVSRGGAGGPGDCLRPVLRPSAEDAPAPDNEFL